jgi:hypothetical protein
MRWYVLLAISVLILTACTVNRIVVMPSGEHTTINVRVDREVTLTGLDTDAQVTVTKTKTTTTTEKADP